MWKLFGGEADTVNQITLFSQRPENRAHAAQVKTITGPGVNFMTDFFAGKAPQDTTTAIRHQAEYDPEEKAWYLVKMSRFDGGAFEDMFKPETVAKTQYIFDALHWCSVFQASSEQDPTLKVINPGKEYSRTFKHWRDVAKEIPLPIAENGVLVLPEKGRLIPDGHYKGDQIAAAYATAQQPASPVVSAAPPPISSTTDAIARYNKAIAKGAALFDTWNITVKNKFTRNANTLNNAHMFISLPLGVIFSEVAFFGFGMPLAGGVALLFLPPLLTEGLAYMKSPRAYPVHFISKRCEEFNKAAALLPDPEDRTLCQKYAKQVEFRFWTGRAVYAKSETAGLPCLDKAAIALGLDNDKLEKLRNIYMTAGLSENAYERLRAAGQTSVTWKDVENRLKTSALKLAG